MKVSIVIPCYILDEQLEDLTYICLSSIEEFSDQAEVILVDNASPRFPEDLTKYVHRYIRNDKNRGNAFAWNQGAEAATGDVIVFVDNDVMVSKGWLEPLVELLKNPEIGIAFPCSMNKDEDDFNEKLCGFCWAIKKENFRKVGPVSLKYGLAYFEDTDYFMRVMQLGLKLRCTPHSTIKHYSRATAEKMPEIAELYRKNEKIYTNTWDQFPYLS